MKKLSEKAWKKIEDEIKMMLHAHRDYLRNAEIDSTKIPFDCRDGYYGEAFGIVRGLVVLGYGYFGANNTPTIRENLKWWFDEISHKVLEEEHFYTTNECDICYEKYGKDAVRTKNSRWH